MKTRSNRRLALVTALGLAVALGGCDLDDNGDWAEAAEPDPDEVSNSLFLTDTPWPTAANGVTTVPVCFRPARSRGTDCDGNEYSNTCEKLADGSYGNCYSTQQWQQKQELVRDALSTAWQQWTAVTFTGFGTCPSNIRGRIAIDMIRSSDSNNFGGCSPVGYHPGGNVISFTTDTGNWRLQRSVIIHEVGHSLGFHHEMDRPDAKYSDGSFICEDKPTTREGGTYATGYYDDVSVMNYCAPGTRNGLSLGDIEGAQAIYRPSSAEPWRKAAASIGLLTL